MPYFPGRCNLIQDLIDSFRTCPSQERWVHLLWGTTNCVLFLCTLIRGLQANFSRFRFRKTALPPVSKGGCSPLLDYVVPSLKYKSRKIQFLPALDSQKLLPVKVYGKGHPYSPSFVSPLPSFPLQTVLRLVIVLPAGRRQRNLLENSRLKYVKQNLF